MPKKDIKLANEKAYERFINLINEEKGYNAFLELKKRPGLLKYMPPYEFSFVYGIIIEKAGRREATYLAQKFLNTTKTTLEESISVMDVILASQGVKGMKRRVFEQIIAKSGKKRSNKR